MKEGVTQKKKHTSGHTNKKISDGMWNNMIHMCVCVCKFAPCVHMWKYLWMLDQNI